VIEGEDCPGKILHDQLAQFGLPAGVILRPVECLSACDHGCSIALSKQGGWSYLYGRMSATDVPEILRGAGLFAASADGIVPWSERPAIFRKQGIARIPPLEA
jgi:predicted metal-binding protein